MSEPGEQRLDLDGCSIRLRRAGRGDPLVFLRGPDASDGWRPVFDRLAETFDVIVPEHPGFGGAARPAWLDCMADFSNFYLDVLDRLDLAGVHLAGWDMGGWMAAEMAVRTTRRLASLTLIASQGLHVDGVETLDTFMRTEEENIADLFHDRALAQAEIARRLTPETEDIRLNDQVVIARATWAPRGYDPQLRKWAHRIDVPTLVLWGAQDRVIPPAHGEAWAGLVRGAQLRVIEGCGHAIHLEKPEETAAAIAAFAAAQRAEA